MKTSCDLVAERVALGEPLGELTEHAASCTHCQRLASLPAELGATRRDVDPGLGFSARITVGAQHRLVVRRRRRIAVGASGAVAVAAIAVLVMSRSPDEPTVADVPGHTPDKPAGEQVAPAPGHEPGAVDPDVKSLLHFARSERSMHASARWASITKPLAPYRALVKGVTP